MAIIYEIFIMFHISVWILLIYRIKKLICIRIGSVDES